MAAAAPAPLSNLTLEEKLADPLTVKRVPNDVDPQFMFLVKDNPSLWNEFRTAIMTDLPAFQSTVGDLHQDTNDDGIASISVAVDIDPREGLRFGDRKLAPRWVLEFRDIQTLSTTRTTPVAEGEGSASSLSAETSGPAGTENLLSVILAANSLPKILTLAQSWMDLTNKLYLGIVHPGLSTIPTVTDVKLVLLPGSQNYELRVRVEEHRNLPTFAINRSLHTVPNTIYRSECGHYLKLTYLLNQRVKTRYFKMLGGFPENVFPPSLPVFDLTELPR